MQQEQYAISHSLLIDNYIKILAMPFLRRKLSIVSTDT